MNGTIKFFDKKKGWGYIKADDGKEYFFHYTQIQMKGHKSLDNDDIVSFEVSEPDGNGRIQAVNVRPILTRRMIEDSLKEENLYIQTIKDGYGVTKYQVVDGNKALQSGENGMTFMKLAAFAGYEIVEKSA